MKISILLILPLLLTLSVQAALAADTNIYSNPTLGVTVTKPKDWQFATLEQHRENIGRSDFKNEEFKNLVQKYSTAPLVVMMKHPEPFDDINPSFKMNIKPLGKLPADDPKAILSVLVPILGAQFKDYELVVSPKEVTVAKSKAAYMKIHYNMEIADAGKFAICSELWVVPRGDYFFLIGAGTRQDEKTGTRKEVQTIIDSLKLD